MTNIVLTNLPSKRKTIEQFISSRGITNFIIFTESTEISELLNDMMTTSQDTFNLHVFDFFGDISLTNTIRDYRDQINILRVYVADTECAKPFLTLTDDVFLLPQFNLLSMFWDCDAFRASNVMAFEASGLDYFKVKMPSKRGKIDDLSISVKTQQVPLRYKTASGSIVETMNQQLVVDCNAKVSNVKDKFDVRRQADVYNNVQRNLNDLAVAKADDLPPEPKQQPKPDVVSATGDKKHSGLTGFFARFVSKESIKDLAGEQKEEQTPVEDLFTETQEAEEQYPVEALSKVAEPIADEVEEVKAEEVKPKEPVPEENTKPKESTAYIGFSGVKNGTEAKVGRATVQRFALADVYTSISQYCVEKGFISVEECSKLAKEVEGKPSKDSLFGNLALERGMITEEQLISAVTDVNHVEILTWEAIKDMELDFTYFTVEKCKEFKFFKLKDAKGSDRVRIICAFSITSIHPEVRRLFNSPKINYTLDRYILRKLEEVTK